MKWRGISLVVVAALHVAFTLVLGLSSMTGTDAPLLTAGPGVGSAQPPNVLLLMILWALFFGAASALQFALQTLGLDIGYQLFLAFPYVLTLAALAGWVGRSRAPAALALPWPRDGH